MAQSPADAIFAAMTVSDAGGSSLRNIELAYDPSALTGGTMFGQTGAPVNDQVDSWINTVNADGAGPAVPQQMIVHERFAVMEDDQVNRFGCAAGSKTLGTGKNPCGKSCGTFCRPQTQVPMKPRLDAPTNIDFEADTGGWSVEADGTTTCGCGSAQTSGGPGGMWGAPAAGLGTGGVIMPNSVFAVAMSWPNIQYVANRLVKAGVILPYPDADNIRRCAGMNRPCLCSYVGPFLASEYRNFIVDWRTQPITTFVNIPQGMDMINQQFEESVFASLYAQASWNNFMAFDRKAGARKFLNERPIIESDVRACNNDVPPHLLAGNYYVAQNGESGSLVRALSGPGKIWQNAFFQSTGIRVGGPDNTVAAQAPEWPLLLAGGQAVPGTAQNLALHSPHPQQTKEAIDRVEQDANGKGVSCTYPYVPDPATAAFASQRDYVVRELVRRAEQTKRAPLEPSEIHFLQRVASEKMVDRDLADASALLV